MVLGLGWQVALVRSLWFGRGLWGLGVLVSPRGLGYPLPSTTPRSRAVIGPGVSLPRKLGISQPSVHALRHRPLGTWEFDGGDCGQTRALRDKPVHLVVDCRDNSLSPPRMSAPDPKLELTTSRPGLHALF